jgi:uncharacterized protein with von Willebrand factor type A (vWA) domain
MAVEGPPEDRPLTREEIEEMAAANAAAREAGKEVSELNEARNALGGIGGDGARPGGATDPEQLRRQFRRIRNSETLARIMALAGKFRLLAQARQRQKTIYGQDEISGVETGNDLPRLLPSELALLADEELDIEALRRYTERTQLQRQFRSPQHKGKGPIVLTTDESGSMGGERNATAKAVALAFAYIAQKQKRWLCLVGYSGGCKPNVVVIQPDRAWPREKVIDWLEHFYSGGTNRDIPTAELPELWPGLKCPEGKTDIISVTDALVLLSTAEVRRFNQWRARINAAYYTIVLGQQSRAERSAWGGIGEISDRVWGCPRLDEESACLQELFAI